MDQLNLLQTSEEKAYESIKPSLVEYLRTMVWMNHI